MSEIQIDGPLQCIVSDMTAFWVKGIYYELTLYMDLWNNEILSHSLSSKRGDRMTYISGLENLLEIKKQHPEYQMILHSDQGSVYASKAYNDLLPMYVVNPCPELEHLLIIVRWNPSTDGSKQNYLWIFMSQVNDQFTKK